MSQGRARQHLCLLCVGWFVLACSNDEECRRIATAWTAHNSFSGDYEASFDADENALRISAFNWIENWSYPTVEDFVEEAAIVGLVTARERIWFEDGTGIRGWTTYEYDSSGRAVGEFIVDYDAVEHDDDTIQWTEFDALGRPTVGMSELAVYGPGPEPFGTCRERRVVISYDDLRGTVTRSTTGGVSEGNGDDDYCRSPNTVFREYNEDRIETRVLTWRSGEPVGEPSQTIEHEIHDTALVCP